MKWPTAQLGAVTKIVSGSTPKSGNPAFWSGDILWATPTDLSGLATKELATTGRMITKAGLASCSAAMLPARSVLFSSRAPIGLVAINKDPLCTNQGFKSFVPEKSRLSPDFLYWWLKCHRAALEHLGRGATFKEVSKSIIEAVEIPLPPLAEQKRIAGILDAADALRAKRSEALAQLDALLQSSFLTLFGDPVTNPMGWPVVPFHRIGKFVSGTTPSKERAEFWGGNIPWVSPKDMKRDFIGSSIDTITPTALEETNIKLIEPGHLLIVVRGMILAHSFPAALNTRPVTINQDMKAIKPAEVFLPLYLLRCMKAQKRGVLAMISEAGHGTKKFDQKSMESTNVPLPPLPLQQKFATIVESIERQKTTQRAHLAELDALFAALQHRAFRGEL